MISFLPLGGPTLALSAILENNPLRTLTAWSSSEEDDRAAADEDCAWSWFLTEAITVLGNDLFLLLESEDTLNIELCSEAVFGRENPVGSPGPTGSGSGTIISTGHCRLVTTLTADNLSIIPNSPIPGCWGRGTDYGNPGVLYPNR